LDSFTVFFEGHGTAVIDVEDDIEECELHDILSYLLGYTPGLT
jgi:hypothetical protein